MDIQEKEEIIYHYTGLEGFLGIVQGKSIRMSHVRALNDPREDVEGRKLVLGLLSGLGFFPGSKESKALDILRNSFSSIGENLVVFVSSFTRQRDSLAQWLEYGSRANGVSIGFRREVLEKIGSLGVIRNVVYSQSEFLDSIQGIFNNYFEQILACDLDGVSETIGSKAAKDRDRHEDVVWQICFNFCVDIVSQTSAFKDPSWAHEGEVRMFWLGISLNSDVQSSLSAMPLETDEVVPVKFRVNSNSLIPYVDIAFPVDKVDDQEEDYPFCEAIESVTIGHKCNADPELISALLNSRDFIFFDVHNSGCSFV